MRFVVSRVLLVAIMTVFSLSYACQNQAARRAQQAADETIEQLEKEINELKEDLRSWQEGSTIKPEEQRESLPSSERGLAEEDPTDDSARDQGLLKSTSDGTVIYLGGDHFTLSSFSKLSTRAALQGAHLEWASHGELVDLAPSSSVYFLRTADAEELMDLQAYVRRGSRLVIFLWSESSGTVVKWNEYFPELFGLAVGSERVFSSKAKMVDVDSYLPMFSQWNEELRIGLKAPLDDLYFEPVGNAKINMIEVTSEETRKERCVTADIAIGTGEVMVTLAEYQARVESSGWSSSTFKDRSVFFDDESLHLMDNERIADNMIVWLLRD